MNRSRVARRLACLALLLAVLSGLLGSSVVFAAEESNSESASPPGQEGFSPEEPLYLDCKFPIVEGIAGESFDFDVSLVPASNELAGRYDFNLITPPGWEATVWRNYPNQKITAIDFRGKGILSEMVSVAAQPLPGKTPEPGEYVITFEAVWGEHKSSIDLTIVITARYNFDIYTDTGRLNTEVKSGEDKHVSILLENTGTAAIENITLSSTKLEGWRVTFDPSKIDSLEPGQKQEVDVLVSPPERTIARDDYSITLIAKSENSSDSLALRVTVPTPRRWAGAGIGITVSVIAGLVVLFRRLSMRYTS